MQLTLVLVLPHDELTVPVARHLVRTCVGELGVSSTCLDAIELALSEACTNVLKHSGPGDEYHVSLELDDAKAAIRVIDTGHGFDFQSLGDDVSDVGAEAGRGVEIMKALVDDVTFTSVPEEGTVVHLEKLLEFDDGAMFQRLSG